MIQILTKNFRTGVFHKKAFHKKVRVDIPRLVSAGILFFSAAGSFSQDETVPDPESVSQEAENGTIPEALRRPRRGEDPRYPEDMVIGELGRGDAPEEAWRAAGDLLSALVMRSRPRLSSVDSLTLDNLLGTLDDINAGAFRLGSGRKEPDGSVSFLIRFMGREEWIAGELYLRPQDAERSRAEAPDAPASDVPRAEAADAADVPVAETAVAGGPAAAGVSTAEMPEAAVRAAWLFDDLLLEEKRKRGTEKDFSLDFSPYERFF
ncbi:MAG: hypothetical protein LBI86_07210 [Treponema sp.]|nr:hypothetical protein [Treponema sp.]